ncbi:MAG: transposase, partial [Chloroflexota bacterium]
MLGLKSRQSKLFYDFSLEMTVPQDDFYRLLEKAVDLSWVRGWVAHCYSAIGRSSVDPEVFAKIELIGYLEGITSERELMRQAADRLSLRRYLGYDIDEALPDHSTLSKIRGLLGEELVEAIMDYSVDLCRGAGMVGGVHASGDRSLVKADASLDSLVPRMVPYGPRDFVKRLYAENPPEAEPIQAAVASLTDLPGYPPRLPAGGEEPLPPETEAVVNRTKPAPARPDPAPVPPAEGGDGMSADKGGRRGARPSLSNATHVSRTDPEARLVSRPGRGPMLAYSAEVWTDARAGVITHADAFPATTPEHATAMQALERQRARFGLGLASVSYDKGCGEGRLYRQLDEAGIVGFIPHQRYANTTSGPGLYELEDFAYDAERDVYVCPGGYELKRRPRLRVNWPSASRVWQARPGDCGDCPLRARCTKAKGYRTLQVGIYQPYYEQMDARLRGPGARLPAIARKTGPELSFAEGKQWQGL